MSEPQRDVSGVASDECGVWYDENGNKWISEERAENEFGIPREILAIWSGRDLPMPATYDDRRIRRHALLRYWARERGTAYPIRVDGGQVRISLELLSDLRDACDPKTQREVERLVNRKRITKAVAEARARIYRYQLLSAIAALAEPDGSDASDGFFSVLERDALAGPVGTQQIVEEWNRYYGGASENL